jgi:hypothetical protein
MADFVAEVGDRQSVALIASCFKPPVAARSIESGGFDALLPTLQRLGDMRTAT